MGRSKWMVYLCLFSFLRVRDLKFVCKDTQVNQIWRNVTTGCKTCKIMDGSMSKYVIYKRTVVWKWISFKMLRCKRSGHVGNMFDLICCYLVANPNQLQIISETAWGALRVALRVRMHGAVIVGRLWRKCLAGYVGMYVQRGLLGFGILITYTVWMNCAFGVALASHLICGFQNHPNPEPHPFTCRLWGTKVSDSLFPILRRSTRWQRGGEVSDRWKLGPTWIYLKDNCLMEHDFNVVESVLQMTSIDDLKGVRFGNQAACL